MRLLAWIVLFVTAIVARGPLIDGPWHLGPLATLLAVIVLAFVAVLIHELGHAVAASAMGADVHRIVVVPFELAMRPRKLRFMRRGHRGDLGGYVTYTLNRIEARRRHAIIASAGPLANIVTGCVAAGVPALDGAGPLSPAAAVATSFTLLSVGLGIGNLIPFEGSDGMHLWRYFRPARR